MLIRQSVEEWIARLGRNPINCWIAMKVVNGKIKSSVKKL